VNITFRTAGPADADAAVPMILASGPAELRYAFGDEERAHAFLRFAFARAGSAFGHACHIVALYDERVAGIAASQCGGWGRMTLDSLRTTAHVLSWFGLHDGLLVAARLADLLRLLPPRESRTMYLSQIAVVEDLRGKGIGTALIQQLIRAARRRGLRSCALYVTTTNARVERLYGRLGFDVVKECPAPPRARAAGLPSVRRMRLRAQPGE